MISEAPFAAVLDYEGTANNNRKIYDFKGDYFNSGFFSATRRFSESYFDRVIACVDHPLRGGCIEQSWMSKTLHTFGLGYEILDRKYNYLLNAPGWKMPADVIHVHYAGIEQKALLPGANNMPFRIETEDYLLTNDRLVCRKGISPNDLWKKHGIHGEVLGALPSTSIMLCGRLVGCRVYRIVAFKEGQ